MSWPSRYIKCHNYDTFHKSSPVLYKVNSIDMRKGHDGLASIVREMMGHNPQNYNKAFIFYSKDYRKVKVLHYDINGWVLYSKWFTSGLGILVSGRNSR